MYPSQILLLYSGFSPACEQLFTLIREAPINITKIAGIQHICVDDEQTRNIILNSTQVDAKYVPCILVTFQNGIVENYTGIQAFQWIEQAIQENMPHQPPPQQPPPQQPPPQHSNLENIQPDEFYDQQIDDGEDDPSGMMNLDEIDPDFIPSRPETTITKGVKSGGVGTDPKESLMQAAEAMQRDRDTMFDAQNPHPNR